MRTKECSWADELSARIRQVRISTFGPRGRARFARSVGVSPSTYNYYERGRIPPMTTLLKISETAGVDLRWLLTGEAPSGGPGGSVSPEHARILARLSALLPRRAEAAAALNALIDLLESQPAGETASTRSNEPGSAPIPQPPSSIRIPLLGRTAAGVPHFWRNPQPAGDLLQSGIMAGAASGESHVATLSDPDDTVPADSNRPVHLVQLAKPIRVGELYIAEFVDIPRASGRWTDAFALRIDGDSMHPSLSHGDLVILCPHEAAKNGRAAVVQLHNQIGVTCKLFYSDKKYVHLIAVNEQFQPTRHPRKDLVWALAVLYRVRLSR